MPCVTEGFRQTGPGNWCGGVRVVEWSSFDIGSPQQLTLLSLLKRDTWYWQVEEDVWPSYAWGKDGLLVHEGEPQRKAGLQ